MSNADLLSEIKSSFDFIKTIQNEELKKTLSTVVKKFNWELRLKHILKKALGRFDRNKIRKYKIEKAQNYQTWLTIYFKDEWAKTSSTVDGVFHHPLIIRINDSGLVSFGNEWAGRFKVQKSDTAVDQIISYIKPEFLETVQKIY